MKITTFTLALIALVVALIALLWRPEVLTPPKFDCSLYFMPYTMMDHANDSSGNLQSTSKAGYEPYYVVIPLPKNTDLKLSNSSLVIDDVSDSVIVFEAVPSILGERLFMERIWFKKEFLIEALKDSSINTIKIKIENAVDRFPEICERGNEVVGDPCDIVIPPPTGNSPGGG